MNRLVLQRVQNKIPHREVRVKRQMRPDESETAGDLPFPALDLRRHRAHVLCHTLAFSISRDGQ